MRGIEIARLLRRCWKIRRVFKGVYASDNLPKHVRKGSASAFVINLDPSHEPGSHWVALYISPFGNATYFDSYGVGPLIPSIAGFISKHSQTFRYNTIVIQDIISRTCGLYCVHFIRKMAVGVTLSEFLSPFKPHHPRFNDKKILALVRG